MNEAAARGSIGVIAPLHAEYRTARPLALAGWQVVRCGVGASGAGAAARALIGAGASRLLVWGTAGALHPALAPGSLVVPEEVAGPSEAILAVDPEWRAALVRCLQPSRPVHGGRMASVARPLASQREKRDLARSSGADTVDMEAAAVLREAARSKIPCAVLRAVVDPLDLELPGVVLAAVGDRFLGAEIALRLCLRPRDLRGVVQLGRAFRSARRALLDSAARLATADLQLRGSLS